MGYADSTGGTLLTLTEQWNGTSWSIVSSPNFGCSDCLPNQLNAVAVGSANDIWAVGFHYSNAGPNQTLIEHWNGTSWSLVSSPNVGTSGNILYGVAAADASHIWAVGYHAGSIPGEQTLTEFYC